MDDTFQLFMIVMKPKKFSKARIYISYRRSLMFAWLFAECNECELFDD